MSKGNLSDVEKNIEAIKADAIGKILVYLNIVTTLFFPLTIIRTINTGWQDIYFLQYLCFLAVFIIYLLREKLAYRSIVLGYIGIGFVVVGIEFTNFGLAGLGEFAALFCLIMSLFYLDKKTTIVVALVVGVMFFMGMYQFVYSGKPIAVDMASYMLSVTAWVAVLIGTVLFFFVVGMSTSYLQKQIIGLSAELELKNNAVEQQRKKIEYLANHDVLTGLPSLRLADKQLDSVLKLAEKNQHESALLFLDLDGFKGINDSYGHDAGDEVLKNIARRILSVIRKTDTACRVGGDEFLIILSRVDDTNDISGLCSRLVNVISLPVSYKNMQLEVGVSIGAAIYPSSASDAQTLRIKADDLMYQVKRAGKNNYRTSMGETASVA